MALNFQQRGSVLTRRLVLVVLIVVSVVLIGVYSREGDEGPLHTVQGAVSGAVSPLRLAGAAASAGTTSLATGIDDFTADESTLSGLRDYNAELIEQYSRLEEYRQEAQRLQQLLDLKDEYAIEGTGARVIGRSSEAWSQTVTIDKGSEDGVDAGQTVMGTSGVVGQVSATSAHTATVRLLADPQSGVAAIVQSSRAEGIVYGSLDGLLYLEDLDADAEVNPGDVVLTSGLGGSFSSGLIIGTVVKVDVQQGDSSRRAVVSPTSEVSALEEVLVVQSVGDQNADAQDGGDGEGDAA